MCNKNLQGYTQVNKYATVKNCLLRLELFEYVGLLVPISLVNMALINKRHSNTDCGRGADLA